MTTNPVPYFCGQIEYFPFNTIPEGWALCDGQVLKSSDYPSAAKLLGDRFGRGADGTFGLPSLLNATGTPANFQPCICLDGTVPSSQETSNMEETVIAYTGQIAYVAFTETPNDWLICDGSVVTIARFTALFQVLGTAFGGDGQTTFGLPDLVTDPTTPAGVTPLINAAGLFPSNSAADETEFSTFCGQVIYTGFSTPPNGWLTCNGALLKMSDYQFLLPVLGTRFGGDGTSTFGLPNLIDSACTPKGLTPIIQTVGTFPTSD